MSREIVLNHIQRLRTPETTEREVLSTSISCECGKTQTVSDEQAGSSVTCRCGFRIVVPLADEFDGRPLLTSAATIERRVHRLIALGELPLPGVCRSCGEVSDVDDVWLTLACERYKVRVSGGTHVLLLPMLFLSMLVWWEEEERVDIRGRDTDVMSPIRLCRTCRQKMRRRNTRPWVVAAILAIAVAATIGIFSVWIAIGILFLAFVTIMITRRLSISRRERQLKNVLSTVPVYRQILDRYPGTAVIWPTRKSDN